MRLYLIRHGETEWNRQARWQGQHDVPLSDAGRRQAQQLGRWLRELRPQRGFVSDLERARETARLALAHWRGRWEIVPALREADFGRWEGRASSELSATAGERFAAYRADPWGSRPPGGESLQDVARRVAQWWRTVAGELDYREAAAYVVVAHGGSLRTLAAYLTAGPDGRDLAPPLANAGCALLQLDQPEARARILWWNRGGHELAASGLAPGRWSAGE